MSYQPPRTSGPGPSRDVNSQHQSASSSSSFRPQFNSVNQPPDRLQQKKQPQSHHKTNNNNSGFSPVHKSQTTPRSAVAFAPLPNSAPAASTKTTTTTMSPNYRLQGSTSNRNEASPRNEAITAVAPSTSSSKKRKRRRNTDQVLLDGNERLELLHGIDGGTTRNDLDAEDEEELEENETNDWQMTDYADAVSGGDNSGPNNIYSNNNDDEDEEVNMQFTRERDMNSPSKHPRRSGEMPQSIVASPGRPGRLSKNAEATGGSIRPSLMTRKQENSTEGAGAERPSRRLRGLTMREESMYDGVMDDDWEMEYSQGDDDSGSSNIGENTTPNESPTKRLQALRRAGDSANKGKDTASTSTLEKTTTGAPRGRRPRKVAEDEDEDYEAAKQPKKQQQQQQQQQQGNPDSGGSGVRPKRTCTQASPPNYTSIHVVSNSPGGKLGVVGEMTTKRSFEVTRTAKKTTTTTTAGTGTTTRGRKKIVKDSFPPLEKSKKGAQATNATSRGTRKGRFDPEEYEQFDEMNLDEDDLDDAPDPQTMSRTTTLNGEEDEEDDSTQSEDSIAFAEPAAAATTKTTAKGGNKKQETTNNSNKKPAKHATTGTTGSRRGSTITVQETPTPAASNVNQNNSFTPSTTTSNTSSNTGNSPTTPDPKTFYPSLFATLKQNVEKFTDSYDKLIDRGLTPAASIMRGRIDAAQKDIEQLQNRWEDFKYLAESEDLADVGWEVKWEMMEAQCRTWMKSDWKGLKM